MTLEKIKKMTQVYTEDVMLLIGGSLIGHSPDLVANARHFLGIAGRTDTYGPLENKRHPASSYPSTTAALTVVHHARHTTESNEEVDKLQKRCVQMEKNVAMLTEMYLKEEKAREELERRLRRAATTITARTTTTQIAATATTSREPPCLRGSPRLPRRLTATTRRFSTGRRMAAGLGSASRRRCTSRTGDRSRGVAASAPGQAWGEHRVS